MMKPKTQVLGWIAVLGTAGALVHVDAQQLNSSAASSSSPVAYVYVSRPTHIDAFAASANGTLKPVPGSPFADTNVTKMSVTKKFLFGQSSDGSAITSYAIHSNGSLTKVSSVNPYKYQPSGAFGCADYPYLQVDFARSTLYMKENPNCVTNAAYLSFRIESNGDLQFLGNSGGGLDNATQGPMERLHLLSNDKFAYDSYCAEDEGNLPVIDIYRRESSGMLQYIGQENQMPASAPGTYYCAGMLTASGNYLAIAVQRIDSQDGDDGWITGPYFLASYSADSKGNLTTTSTYEDMPETTVANQVEVTAMSIAPTHDLLAVGGDNGFQIFHFNGAKPITKYSGVLHPTERIIQFGWDKAHHLYVLAHPTNPSLGGNQLYIYTATPTSIKEAPGSPYTIKQASNLSVLDLP